MKFYWRISLINSSNRTIPKYPKTKNIPKDRRVLDGAAKISHLSAKISHLSAKISHLSAKISHLSVPSCPVVISRLCSPSFRWKKNDLFFYGIIFAEGLKDFSQNQDFAGVFGEPGVFCLPFFSRKTSWSWNNQVPRLTSKNRMVLSRKFPADSCYKSNTSLKQTAQQQLWEEEPKPVAVANLLFALKGWVIQTDFVHRGKTVWKKNTRNQPVGRSFSGRTGFSE